MSREVPRPHKHKAEDISRGSLPITVMPPEMQRLYDALCWRFDFMFSERFS